ncbi:hypothetical protein SH1V18_32890 [Vallitalea longa]|uniref:Uncharacterized protein n=1 Tax=Vallitalea longa TaxID=2936439 RepID=A0A9W5YD03_9FIRM|nr:hypothetical protein [Vallitalea longa]GKX30809.1 hypothetical protein SH1V18_32890 [Vallitalea longa]
MGCNISTCCGIGSSLIGGCKCSVQYGYTDKVITITAAGTFNIWQADMGLPGLSGTFVVQPQAPLPNNTFVSINGGALIAIQNDILSNSVNPLESVDIITGAGTTELCVSIIATGFECC